MEKWGDKGEDFLPIASRKRRRECLLCPSQCIDDNSFAAKFFTLRNRLDLSTFHHSRDLAHMQVPDMRAGASRHPVPAFVLRLCTGLLKIVERSKRKPACSLNKRVKKNIRRLRMEYVMVPEVGIEPTRAQGPLDFESSASTSFTTPASAAIITAEPLLLSSSFPSL